MKILVVDDTPSNIDILVEYLQHKYELLISLSGKQALKILETTEPDLILLDIMMPEMDGFETCIKIKENKKIKDIPVIFLTANSDEGSIKQAFESGGVDFINKPIVLSELNARIETHLNLASYRSDLEAMVEEQTKVITQKSNELLQKLYFDDNTRLKNMLSLEENITKEIGNSLLLLDINNFNVFNKMHSFFYGDKILKEVAKNLNFLFSQELDVYKLSADRFAIIVQGTDVDKITSICEEIFAFFDMTEIVVEEIDNLISFNIGIAKIEKGIDNIIDAEFALDISKQHGKHFKVFYHDQLKDIEKEKEKIRWLHKTRDYINKDYIEPYYQPIVDVQTKQIYKYEALARIVDGKDVITPDKFLDAANKLGLMTSITKSMINKAFQQFANSDTKFSINITERDIMDGYLMDFIKVKAEINNINPKNVTFEILENLTLSSDSDMITKTLGLVKDYGCAVAIDDFGSENSNFGRLLSLNSDYLKIDGAFIKDCDTNYEKREIIFAVVALAKNLGIKTIAEFVSTEAIFETIKILGVDYAQGYLFGKPEQIQD